MDSDTGKRLAVGWMWLVVLLSLVTNYLLNARYVSAVKTLLGL